jgi:hypothetical protein
VGLQALISHSLLRFGLLAIQRGGLCDQTLAGEFGHKGGSVAWRLAPRSFVLGLSALMFPIVFQPWDS